MSNYRGIEIHPSVFTRLSPVSVERVIDWVAKEMGVESFARSYKNLVIKLRKGAAGRGMNLATYRGDHTISLLDKGHGNLSILGFLAHELVHAVQFVAGPTSPHVPDSFRTLAARGKYRSAKRKAYLLQPIEIQAYAIQYKFLQEEGVSPEWFSSSWVKEYEKLGIDILNIL